MKMKRWLMSVVFVLVATALVVSLAAAEDGKLFRRNVSKTPEAETEKAAVFMMDFYVPAQDSTGLVAPVDNYYADTDNCDVSQGVYTGCEQLYEPRDYAKPLVSAYIDDIGAQAGELEALVPTIIDGGITFGAFDAFIGVSLDDGTSWRTENLSRSSGLSSFTLKNGTVYPGDVHNVVHQVAEDKILAVWASKYCQSGFPLYSLDPAVTTTAAYLEDLETTYSKNALYLYDLFGVAGNQGSVDYTELGYKEIGEIPYSCIWTARGKLIAGDDPKTTETVEASHVVWTNPERLTSGVRDANLPAVDCAKNAGCALTWQEDPEGLRPGKGLGPGEGWSGAIVNAKTDIWYSFISFADFDLVVNDDGDGVTEPGEALLIEEYEALKKEAMDRPKPYVPMAMPVRLTDNDMCRGTSNKNPEDPFCWIDFDSIDDLDHTNIVNFLDTLATKGPETGADFCATTVEWTNPGGTTLPICVTEDGRWMIGRVGSSRVRMVIKPYTPPGAPDHDSDGVPDASAWLSLGSEETKALGITTDTTTTLDPVDIGKDMFYYSFDFAKPYNLHVNTKLDVEDDSAYIVQQGGMLNQPAKCSDWFPTYEDMNPDIQCTDGHGEFFDTLLDPITGYEYYLTEISRRFAMTLNNIPNITNTEINESGLAGMLIYKQGVIWQGGPADIMLRRLAIPDGFDPTVDNPFAFENMDCDEWLYTDGSNPNYLKGLCLSPAINISGTSIKECTTGSGNDECAETFPVSEDGSIYVELENFPKVSEWRQCDADGNIVGCENDDDLTGDLDDQSWENPFDVAKGHRGFLYGDYVMMMYAWSPNWQSNAVGNDHYNLYQRRSFDGGLTWTTTPAALGGAGLDALEYYYGDKIGEYVPYVWTYGAGEFEQARNLSLLHGNKVTILDPRYSPPGGLKQYSTIRTDWLTANGISFEGLPYEDDLAIDPSKYYMVYETGDNTTVAVGEAIPLDLFYSRATVYGDVYEWFDYVNDTEDCNPVPGEPIDLMYGTCEPRWPWLENAADDLSGEASVVLNPGGTFAYNVWNQWKEEITHYYDEYGTLHEEELVYDSDMIFRRLLYLPDDSTIELTPTITQMYVNDYIFGWTTDTITLAATARDFDKLGDVEIVEYEWLYSTADGEYTDVKVGDGKVLQIGLPGWAMKPGQPGWATFSIRAKDAEGNWSEKKTVEIYLAPIIYKVYSPVIVR